MNFLEFLQNKPLYYDEIDLERMPRAYKAIEASLQLPRIVHVVGTNGKGTTGRFLASALLKSGMNTGHYTSPHILKFNERIWINGSNAADSVLQQAHERLYGLVGSEISETLSYFEYTTLMAMIAFEQCDIVVLEAGLGGEFDATNVFAKALSLFTPIDFDHQAFLGESIEEIASTKLRSMAKTAIIGEQPHKEVLYLFEKIGHDKKSETYRFADLLSDNDIMMVKEIAQKQALPAYLEQNLMLSIAALKTLDIAYNIESFDEKPMFGRLSRVSDTVYLDVGHNVLAAKAIASSLKDQRLILVYNSYKDKEVPAILSTLKPIIESVEIIEVDDARIEKRENLESVLQALEISYKQFEKIEKEKQYLVFGSFSVAEAFLKHHHYHIKE